MRSLPEIVVVAYGSVDLLEAALAGLSDDFTVRIVDNSLSDEVRAIAVAEGCDYVRPPENVGFGAAVNLALARVQPGADVLLLNPDARLAPAGVVSLQEHLRRHPRTAAVAPLLQRPDGRIEPTRWPLPTPTLPWRGIVGRGALRPGEPFFLSGAVLLLSAEALADVGGFDERFFLYSEEADWQWRALQHGYGLHEVDEIVAAHVGAATSHDTVVRERYFHGSAELFVRKWYGSRGWALFRSGSLIAALRRLVTERGSIGRRRALVTIGLYVAGPARRLPPRRRLG